MRNLLIASFALALFGHTSIASAAAPQRACAASLNDLADAWNAIGFSPPAKPAQAIVSGRYGYQTSSMEFGYMVSQIQMAVRDCQAGRYEAAAARVEGVQRLLPKPAGDVRLGPPVFPAPRSAAAPSSPPALGPKAHPASNEAGS